MPRSDQAAAGSYGRRAIALLGELAWRDYLNEWRISACFVLALMAVLAPLLVLFGLKFGVIDTLAQRLIERPETRAIVPVGHRNYTREWLAELADQPEVGFLIPTTRRLAASFSLLEHPASGRQARAVQMVPSAAGDPLLADAVMPPQGDREVVLSEAAARRLSANTGDSITAYLTRQHQGRDENVRLPLRVSGILPASSMSEEAALVALDLLIATEAYRDGFAVERLGWDGNPGARPDVFPRFRLYADSIYRVAALAERLRADGVEVLTRSDEIAQMQHLERNLNRVFWLLALLGASGYLASLGANLAANVARKRGDLGILRLLGVQARWLPLFPVQQGMLTGFLGVAAALLAYWPIAAALNLWFTDSLREGERICRLLPWHILAALLLTLAGSMLAALWAGHRAARLDPAESLKHA